MTAKTIYTCDLCNAVDSGRPIYGLEWTNDRHPKMKAIGRIGAKVHICSTCIDEIKKLDRPSADRNIDDISLAQAGRD